MAVDKRIIAFRRRTGPRVLASLRQCLVEAATGWVRKLHRRAGEGTQAFQAAETPAKFLASIEALAGKKR